MRKQKPRTSLVRKPHRYIGVESTRDSTVYYLCVKEVRTRISKKVYNFLKEEGWLVKNRVGYSIKRDKQ